MNAPACGRRYRRCRAQPRSRKAVSWSVESCLSEPPRAPGLLDRLSPGMRIGTSGLDARRAKPGVVSAPFLRKRRHDHKIRPRNSGKDQLSDTVPGPDLDRGAASGRIAVPRRNEAGPLVIGIDHADRIAEHQPPLVAEA